MSQRVRSIALGFVLLMFAIGAIWVMTPHESAAPERAAVDDTPIDSPTPPPPDGFVDSPPPAPVVVKAKPVKTAKPLGDRSSGPDEPDAAPKHETHGRVIDEQGNPIPNAELGPFRPENYRLMRMTKLTRMWRKSYWIVSTGSDGTFKLPELPYSGLLQVKAGGFVTKEVPLAQKRKKLTITLRRARRLLGTVVAAEDISPIANAKVVGQGNHWHQVLYTDPVGRFTFDAPSGEVWLLVSKQGRVSQVWREGQHPTIELKRGRTIKGRVWQSDGRDRYPGGRAIVIAVGATQPGAPQSVRANDDGTYEIEGGIKPDEEFAILAIGYRYATPNQPVWTPAGADPQDVTMVQRGSVTLRNGPTYGRLHPEPVDTPKGVYLNPYTSSQVADPEKVTFHQLAAGKYQFTHDGRRVGEVFEVTPGKTTAIEWLPRTAEQLAKARTKLGAGRSATGGRVYTLMVRVQNAKGTGIPNAEVIATQDDLTRRARTSRTGIAQIKVPAGDWRLRAKRRGLQLREAKMVPAHDSRVVRLVLVDPITLKGRLKPPKVAAVRVFAASDANTEVAQRVTKGDGRFEIPNLAPGSYRLEIQVFGSSDVSAVEIELPLPSQAAELEVDLSN